MKEQINLIMTQCHLVSIHRVNAEWGDCGRALLQMPVDPFLHRVDVDEGQPAPAFSSWATFPQVQERRRDPSVDGAGTPPNRASIAPCRSTSMSSVESAPAAMPATRHGTIITEGDK